MWIQSNNDFWVERLDSVGTFFWTTNSSPWFHVGTCNCLNIQFQNVNLTTKNLFRLIRSILLILYIYKNLVNISQSNSQGIFPSRLPKPYLTSWYIAYEINVTHTPLPVGNSTPPELLFKPPGPQIPLLPHPTQKLDFDLDSSVGLLCKLPLTVLLFQAAAGLLYFVPTRPLLQLPGLLLINGTRKYIYIYIYFWTSWEQTVCLLFFPYFFVGPSFFFSRFALNDPGGMAVCFPYLENMSQNVHIWGVRVWQSFLWWPLNVNLYHP